MANTGASTDRNFFKKLVAINNPGSVTIKETPPPVNNARFDEHSDEEKFRAQYGRDSVPDSPRQAPPQPVDLRKQTKNIMKNALLIQAEQHGGPVNTPTSQPLMENTATLRSNLLTESQTMLNTLRDLATAIGQATGSITNIGTENVYGEERVHLLVTNQDHSRLVIECTFNRAGLSSAEVTVDLYEEKAHSETIRRNYQTSAALLEDFANFFASANKHLND